MDKIDRKILSLLQENARYPLKYLAQKVFLSSPAVSTRIERMEKAGIITGYHATIDPVALGYHITAFINLTLDPKQKNEDINVMDRPLREEQPRPRRFVRIP